MPFYKDSIINQDIENWKFIWGQSKYFIIFIKILQIQHNHEAALLIKKKKKSFIDMLLNKEYKRQQELDIWIATKEKQQILTFVKLELSIVFALQMTNDYLIKEAVNSFSDVNQLIE